MIGINLDKILILGGFDNSGRLGDGIIINTKTQKVTPCFKEEQKFKFQMQGSQPQVSAVGNIIALVANTQRDLSLISYTVKSSAVKVVKSLGWMPR